MQDKKIEIIIPTQLEQRTLDLVQQVNKKIDYIQIELKSINNIIMRLDAEIQQMRREQ